ncbi:SPFH domain-containing protein [Tumidithrix elongata RA019]|uniref:SPFH domain-containing protein n=1 Tax=Tumidithrix elongata BACA0141 TaxID=2716417 RepID=A0AAW9Q677_9CYAN|nr:SPFH domain-containing protein [Tumidithrix elongata RA019]
MQAALITLLFALLTGSYLYKSARVIPQDKQSLVTRLGRYHKTLRPGLNFVFPLIDKVDFERSTSEQTLEIPPRSCTTSDEVSMTIKGTVYWQITNLYNARYNIQKLEQSLENSFAAEIQAQIGTYSIEQVIVSQTEISQKLLADLAEDSKDWGVAIKRIELGDIVIPESVRTSMEKQKAAEIESRATELRSEGERKAEVNKAEAEAESRRVLAESERDVRFSEAKALAEAIELVSQAIAKYPHGQEAMQFLLAQNYIDMGKAIGQSPSSKVMFMDPKTVPGMVQSLLAMVDKIGSPPDGKQPFGASGSVRDWAGNNDLIDLSSSIKKSSFLDDPEQDADKN